MKITFLLQNAYGIGGTIRATFNAASALSEQHDVEIASVWRTLDAPCLALGGKVRLTPLIDKRAHSRRNDLGHRLLGVPTALIPPVEARGASFDRLTDQRVAAFLARTDADVVVATRPGLVIYLAEFGRRHYLRIGQEHRIYETHEPAIRAAQDTAIAALDAHTTVSEADAVTHRTRLAATGTLIVCIPNAVAPPLVSPSDGTAKLVIAAGRLIPVKQYGRLVRAFGAVVAERPDWKLRIYGRGPEQASLRAHIDAQKLNHHISLMGASSSLAAEWAKGSIAAVTSSEESFGMTIVEAMQCGLPVVATDCPHGPREIIKDGEDGLLVPTGDTGAIAKGLMALIDDEALRHSMGRAARVNIQRYTPQATARLYEDLVARLHHASPHRRTPTRLRLAADMRRAMAAGGRAWRSSVPVARRALAHPAEALRPLRPQATCHVDAVGDLVVLLDRTGMPGSRFTLTATPRGARDPEAEQIAVPVHRPESATGPWRAVLERRIHELAEGRWDLHVIRSDDNARRRVASRCVEQSNLLKLRPLTGTPFSWWIPYSTDKNNLSVRTWCRPAHAEVHTLTTDDTSCTVEGALYGAESEHLRHPRLLAVPRRNPAAAFESGVTLLSATAFRFTLSYSQARTSCEGEEEIWDLALRLAPHAPPIRLARITGDIVNRKRTDVYPAVETPGATTGTSALVRPYFTERNDLALKLSSRPR
ncbi:glycosyltransferase [Streptomyces sp. YS-3]|uniref:glycosyltransferase n=1 Tax=Streptomyces sp. YS-3 TaxID=3381352 RepID=UPI003862A54D